MGKKLITNRCRLHWLLQTHINKRISVYITSSNLLLFLSHSLLLSLSAVARASEIECIQLKRKCVDRINCTTYVCYTLWVCYRQWCTQMVWHLPFNICFFSSSWAVVGLPARFFCTQHVINDITHTTQGITHNNHMFHIGNVKCDQKEHEFCCVLVNLCQIFLNCVQNIEI